MHIRRADVSDSQAIARIQVNGWHAVYKGIMPPGASGDDEYRNAWADLDQSEPYRAGDSELAEVRYIRSVSSHDATLTASTYPG
jgi:hypothetical protein